MGKLLVSIFIIQIIVACVLSIISTYYGYKNYNDNKRGFLQDTRGSGISSFSSASLVFIVIIIFTASMYADSKKKL